MARLVASFFGAGMPMQSYFSYHHLTSVVLYRSSLSMRINSLAQVGGVNSLENFARSWQRAAGFNELPPRPAILVSAAGDDEERIGARRSEPSPTERRSLLRQQLERQESASQAILSETPPSSTSDTPTIRPAPARSLDEGGGDVLDRAPYLASPYASSNGGLYGSLSSRVNESSLQHAGRLFEEQQLAGTGEPDKETEPLLIRHVEQEDGTIIEEVVGRSTLPQTVLNSVNVLVGVGILSLPLALSYSGWVFGVPFLLLAALATRYTAGLLAKCLNRFPKMTHFSEIGHAAFGTNMWIVMEILITLELGAANVALVVLFADSLNALIPDWGIVEWKIVCGIIILPLNFVPLQYLSITSVLGVLCSLGILVLVFTDGVTKGHSPGSLLKPAPTYPFPHHWSTLPLSFGLFMGKRRGSPISKMVAESQKLHGEATLCFRLYIETCGTLASFEKDLTSPSASHSVRDEITSSILLTAGYPPAISVAMVVFIAVIPITKIPLK
ncbi:MAG: hypothetical protein Q9221_000120 [Calogaya cf. arnoldii]